MHPHAADELEDVNEGVLRWRLAGDQGSGASSPRSGAGSELGDATSDYLDARIGGAYAGPADEAFRRGRGPAGLGARPFGVVGGCTHVHPAAGRAPSPRTPVPPAACTAVRRQRVPLPSSCCRARRCQAAPPPPGHAARPSCPPPTPQSPPHPHTHTPIHTSTHTHTNATSGVEVMGWGVVSPALHTHTPAPLVPGATRC